MAFGLKRAQKFAFFTERSQNRCVSICYIKWSCLEDMEGTKNGYVKHMLVKTK